MRTLAREKKVKAEYSFKRGEISNLMRIKQRFLYISTEYKKNVFPLYSVWERGEAENNYEKYDSNRPQSHKQQTNR